MKFYFFVMLLIFSTFSIADEPETECETEQTQTGSVDPLAPACPEATESRIDRSKRKIDSQVQRAAQWADGFFQDANYEAEVATTQFRVRPEFYYRDKQGAKFRARASLRVRLPGLGSRVSLIAGSGVDDLDAGGSVDDSDEDAVLGLQFFGKSSRHWHTSMSIGMKFSEFAFFAGPRARYFKRINDKSSFSFTQSVRYQTNNYWQINSRIDLNHVFSDRYFFRQTFDGRWRGEDSDEEGYRTRVSSFLTQRLENAAGLQYEFSTIFHTRPDNHVDRYTVAVRYRKQTWRSWFYYEIAPQISFEDKYDYAFNPGIRLRIELFFGATDDQTYWRKYYEDTEDFRW